MVSVRHVFDFELCLACVSGAQREREYYARETEDTHERERSLCTMFSLCIRRSERTQVGRARDRRHARERALSPLFPRGTDFARARRSESLDTQVKLSCALR